MADGQFTLAATIEIDGTPLDPSVIPDVEHVSVDDYLLLPDMFVLTLRDRDQNILETARMKVGSKVKISGSALGDARPEQLILGEITSVEAEYGPGGHRAVVRGYDLSHRLHRGVNTETYRNMKDSDVAAKIAARAKIPVGPIDDTGATYEHISQTNTSDWDFLTGRAAEIGFEISVEDGKFNFRKPTPSSKGPQDGDLASTNPAQLVLGRELLEFHPRVTASGQVKEVQVRGWDPIAKQTLVGIASAVASSAKLLATPATLASTFGDAVHVSVDRPLSTQRAVDAAAKALAEHIGSAFAEAAGIAVGNPKLKSGVAVSIGLVASHFAGQYTLTQTRHDFDARGYRTHFVISGRHERSLRGLTSNGAGPGVNGTHVDGVVVAIVTNVDDPQKHGRVRVKFPWLSDKYESDWARMCQFGAGPNSGALFLPEVGDEVLVAFEFGDVRRPYVVGSLYNGKDLPRGGQSLLDNGKVNRRGITSRKGHRALFFDGASNAGVALITSDDKLKIEMKETGTVLHISSDGTIEIEGKGDISIKGNAGISIQATGQLQLKGATVAVEGSGPVTVKGATVSLN
jgi:phage protein D